MSKPKILWIGDNSPQAQTALARLTDEYDVVRQTGPTGVVHRLAQEEFEAVYVSAPQVDAVFPDQLALHQRILECMADAAVLLDKCRWAFIDIVLVLITSGITKSPFSPFPSLEAYRYPYQTGSLCQCWRIAGKWFTKVQFTKD